VPQDYYGGEFLAALMLPWIFSACQSSPTSKSSTLQALLKYPSTCAKSIFYGASKFLLWSEGNNVSEVTGTDDVPCVR
jgi:hypothetical protein